MRRILVSLFLGAVLSFAPCVGQVQESFFGLHQNKYKHGEPFPTVPFGVRRTVSDIVKWSDLEGCPGGPDPGNPCYHWGKNLKDGNLDKVINDSAEHGVPVMFTFYSVPEWASTRGPRCRGAGQPDAHCLGPADTECGGRGNLQVLGSCDPPYDLDAVMGSGEGDGSDKFFKDFVTAVATRYGKKIKYWEMWNEASNIRFGNPSNFTVKQFARMTKDLHEVVKSINPDAVVLGANLCKCSPPGSAKFRPWTEAYFTALDKYGASAVDGISYHGYDQNSQLAEEFVGEIRDLMDKHPSTQGKAYYDTEDAWPRPLQKSDGTIDWDAESAWIARALILHASDGSKSYIYFGWDLEGKGQMWSKEKSGGCTIPNKDGKEGYLCPTAPAYEATRSWLLGATFDKPCSSKGAEHLWTCDFTKNNGSYHGRFVWYEAGGATTNYAPEKQFARSRDLDGNATELKAKSQILLGQKPVLLEMN
ncbi:MAG TPA: hypothetical protein VK829_03975 [Terriglobales bacterium]|nr:hypothetical protein [Terriglobales bacterium]